MDKSTEADFGREFVPNTHGVQRLKKDKTA
jgi:hypothetical protein